MRGPLLGAVQMLCGGIEELGRKFHSSYERCMSLRISHMQQFAHRVHLAALFYSCRQSA
jgi:hypothetical protein